jgi:RNA polymerase sigma factor (TIGR02999 family)
MDQLSKAHVTRLLKETSAGSSSSAKDLFAVVYEELRAIAGAIFRKEKIGHTLQPTALVHEAYLRLVDAERLEGTDRACFLAAAARVMRQVLIDHARRKGADKRGGDRLRVVLEESSAVVTERDVDVISFEELLGELERLDERKAKVAELKLYSGMTFEETGAALGISSKTAEADWYMARAWLRAELKRKGLAPS